MLQASQRYCDIDHGKTTATGVAYGRLMGDTLNTNSHTNHEHRLDRKRALTDRGVLLFIRPSDPTTRSWQESKLCYRRDMDMTFRENRNDTHSYISSSAFNAHQLFVAVVR